MKNKNNTNIADMLAWKWSEKDGDKFTTLRNNSAEFYSDCRAWGVNPYLVADMIGDIKYIKKELLI